MTDQRKGKFTRGHARFNRHEEWSQYFGNIVVELGEGENKIGNIRTVSCQLKYDTDEVNKANADLTVAAFNSATACESIGYDGQTCIEMLPEMLKILACLQSVDDYFLPGSGFTRDQMDAVFVKNGITAGTSVAELRNNLSQLLSKLKG